MYWTGLRRDSLGIRETECDSEVLGMPIARFSGPLVRRAS